VDGVWVRATDPTRRLVGTLCTGGASLGLDTPAHRLLWNATPARRRLSQPLDFDTRAVNSVSYAVCGSTTNRIEFVAGTPGGTRVQARGKVSVYTATPTQGSCYNLSFGVDAIEPDSILPGCASATGTVEVTTDHSDAPTTPGRHYWQLVERSLASVTVYGQSTGTPPAYTGGILGVYEG
jgi:hypothetical protein